MRTLEHESSNDTTKVEEKVVWDQKLKNERKST